MKLNVIHFDTPMCHPQTGPTKSFSTPGNAEAIELFPQIGMVAVKCNGEVFYFPVSRSCGAGAQEPAAKK